VDAGGGLADGCGASRTTMVEVATAYSMQVGEW
jgi:hypothetical protein